MTISTHQSTTSIGTVSLALLLACGMGSEQTNLAVTDIALHTHLNPDQPDYEELGEYARLERYNLHTTLAPAEVDAVISVVGEGDLTLVLDVIPVAGLTNWDQTEGTTDPTLLEQSKTQLASYYRFEQDVSSSGAATITFPSISLEQILDRFAPEALWPCEIIFRVAVLPIRGERDLADNVREFRLLLDPPD